MHRISLPIVIALSGAAAADCPDQRLTNGGFETTEGVGTALPSVFNDWAGDFGMVTGPTLGITPYEGEQMFQFVAAHWNGLPSSNQGCAAIQLVDLAPLRSLIDTNSATATVSAVFNRVAGDAETDTRFRVEMRTYAGFPADYPAVYGTSFLSRSQTPIITGGDPLTWQPASAEIPIPAEADYLAVWVAAEENVVNNTTEAEFAGHFVDDVCLTIVGPSPCGVVTSLSGQIGLIDPPPSIDSHVLEDSTRAVLFCERQGAFLIAPLEMDITAPGNYVLEADLTPGDIPATSRVSSYMVHFDPVATQDASVTGEIRLSEDVLAIAANGSELAVSSDILGLPGTIYNGPEGMSFRREDTLTLLPDRRTIQFHFFANNGRDGFRVVVPGGCACDWQTDGTIDVFDLLAYLSDWFPGSFAADFNGDQALNVFDLLDFLDCWFGPCP